MEANRHEKRVAARRSHVSGARAPDASSVARDWLPYLLMAEKSFQRVKTAPGDYRGRAIDDVVAGLPPFGFVGTCVRWWQPTFIALVEADGIDLAGMEQFAARFFALVNATYSLGGGTYGLLGFVFERPPGPTIIERVRKLKRSEVGRKTWMAAWTIDLSAGRVIPHSWTPFGLYPGRAYIEKAVRRMRGLEGPPIVMVQHDLARRGKDLETRRRVLVWVIGLGGIILALLFAWANGYQELLGELGRHSP